MHQQQGCSRRSPNAKNPAEGIVPTNRSQPEHDREQKQAPETHPFKRAASSYVNMRIATALAAFPVFPVANRQDRDPEHMANVEGSHCPRPARLVATQTVVIAKPNPLRPEMVSTINDEHCVRRAIFRITSQGRRAVPSSTLVWHMLPAGNPPQVWLRAGSYKLEANPSAIAVQSPSAEFHSYPRRWCTTSRRGKTSRRDNLW